MHKSWQQFITILLFLHFTCNLIGQNLDQYQWKNRLLVITTNSENNKTYQNQLEAFKNAESDFNERKLILFVVKNNQYKKIDFTKKNTHEVWLDSNLKKKYALPKNEDFKIILIGLDGGLKLSQNNFLQKSKLFNLIDAMPMRAAELNGY